MRRPEALDRRRRLAIGLSLATLCFGVAGLGAGVDGWSSVAAFWKSSPGVEVVPVEVVVDIRLPRTLGAWLTGALLGLAGATAQGLFRNPLADPYLLGAASGASLGVVAVLAAGSIAGHAIGLETADLLGRASLAGAAFCGAALGMLTTLLLARGAGQTTRLLLSGVVVGVLLSAAGDLLTAAAPEALRGKQAFLLGSTAYLGWPGCGLLGIGLLMAVPLATHLARALDALALGEDSAASLGLDLPRLRLALVGVVALGTGLAVAQTGLIAFVGLVAPHLVRRFASASHRYLLIASAAAGGVLLLMADVLARSLVAPREVPVGILTALLGGGYLLWLLRRQRFA